MRRTREIDFAAVNQAVAPVMHIFIYEWLPEGRYEGHEWVARNPTRVDRRPGSFKINFHKGAWADFATGDSGGDAISLRAYLRGISQKEAAIELADMIGMGNDRYK